MSESPPIRTLLAKGVLLPPAPHWAGRPSSMPAVLVAPALGGVASLAAGSIAAIVPAAAGDPYSADREHLNVTWAVDP